MGSSSALAVALVRLARGRLPWLSSRVLEAGALERAHSRAGWQDYLPAVYGGFGVYRIEGCLMDGTYRDAAMAIEFTPVSPATADLSNRYGLLLYTGESRPADSVLGYWKRCTEQVSEIKAIADTVAGCIDTITLEGLSRYLKETWEQKCRIGGVTHSGLNWQYQEAIDNGALAGKLLGAGAGGCWFFLVSPDNRERGKQALGLREIPFQIAEKGVETWER